MTKLKLTPATKYEDDIFQYLYEKEDLQGNEEYLVGERLADILGKGDRSALIPLEVWLSEKHDYVIDLPLDLRLEEVTIEELQAECNESALKALKSMNNLKSIDEEVRTIKHFRYGP